MANLEVTGNLKVNGKNILEMSSLPLGAIVTLTCESDDVSLHLADGSELAVNGIYAQFCNYVINNQSKFPTCTAAEYQTAISTYGECGKYVITDTYVKLPTIKSILQSTTNTTENGNTVPAGLPNITGSWWSISNTAQTERFGAVTTNFVTRNNNLTSGNTVANNQKTFTASDSNPIYGNSNTVQPQTIKYLHYIVVGTSVKTDVEVDIDNVVNDLNAVNDNLGILDDKVSNVGQIDIILDSQYDTAGNFDITDYFAISCCARQGSSTYPQWFSDLFPVWLIKKVIADTGKFQIRTNFGTDTFVGWEITKSSSGDNIYHMIQNTKSNVPQYYVFGIKNSKVN